MNYIITNETNLPYFDGREGIMQKHFKYLEKSKCS